MAKDKAAAQEGDVKKKGKGKIVIILVVVLVAGIGAKFTVLSGGKASGKATPAPAPTPTPGVVIDLGTMTINLADPGRYALVGLAVELGPTGTAEKFTPEMPLLKDATVRKLAGWTAAKLLTAAGQEDVRTQLTDQAQLLFGKDSVVKVLLTELIVQ
ncbi:MAG TPA: flagellar basal body-associated FliL family protein [Actinomycetota bacterium]